PRLDASLEEDQRAFMQILLRNLRLFAPDDDLVPFRALLAFAVAIFIGLVRGHREVADGLTPRGVTRFGVAPQPAYQNGFVHRHASPSDRGPEARPRKDGT